MRHLVGELRGLLVHRVHAGRRLPGRVDACHAGSLLVILTQREVLRASSSRLRESGLIAVLDDSGPLEHLVGDVLAESTVDHRVRSRLVFAGVEVAFDDSLIVIAFIRPDGFRVSLIRQHHGVVRILQVIRAFADHRVSLGLLVGLRSTSRDEALEEGLLGGDAIGDVIENSAHHASPRATASLIRCVLESGGGLHRITNAS